jgi:hypothetical protein
LTSSPRETLDAWYKLFTLKEERYFYELMSAVAK